MGELMIRVCDIFESPVIRVIGQTFYRQVAIFCLVIFIFTFNTGKLCAKEKISRFAIVSALYERVYNQEITEMKAVSIGLLEPFEDGQYHLDWPVTRGMAAKMFYTLAIQSGAVMKLPRAFADIKPDNEYRRALYTVGGAFLPHRDGRFDADYIITKKEMFHAISVLIEKGILQQTDMSNAAHEVMSDPVLTEFSVASKSEVDKHNNNQSERKSTKLTPFRQNNNYDHLFGRRTTKKLGRAEKLVKMQQMNPQTMSTISDAFTAMGDVKKIMPEMTVSTINLIELKPKSKSDKRAVRKALIRIEKVLKGMVERFEYSKVQLNNVIPVDPVQIRKCSRLNAELTRYIKEAQILRDKIVSRMASKK